MISDIYLKEVIIQDVEKRRMPSKYYVYRIKVSWSDGKIHIIFRRYSQFYSLQDNIFHSFPEESGVTNPAKRMVPLLPGKIIFGRSQIREVAVKRKELINQYLQDLIKLPEHISRCTLVLDFLTPSQDDVNDASRSVKKRKDSEKGAENISDPIALEQYNVIANYKSDDRKKVSLACGDVVGVIEKHDNGWWFVCIEDQQGWVPSSYLEPVFKGGEDESWVVVDQVERYICIKECVADQNDELSLKLGDIVTLKVKNRDGWWKVVIHSDAPVKQEGFVPACHLKLCSAVVEERPAANRGVRDVIKAPPRQNTVKKGKRPKDRKPPPRPPPSEQQLKTAALTSSATETTDADEEIVIYVCGRSYKDADTGGKKFSVEEGVELLVEEKSANGWWKVRTETQEGWIPSYHVQRKRRLKSKERSYPNVLVSNSTNTAQLFSTIGAYASTDPNGLSFQPGQVVELVEKDPTGSGWWFVKLGEREGWAPSNFLQKLSDPSKDTIQNVLIDPGVPENEEDYENVCVPANKPVYLPNKPVVAPKPKPRDKPIVTPKPKPGVRTRTHIPSSANRNRTGTEVNPPFVTAVTPSGGVSNSGGEATYSNIDGGTAIYSNVDVADDGRTGETYVALADYMDNDTDKLSFKVGQLLLVTTKEDNGWWFAKEGNREGWVPSNYLKQ